MSQKLLITQAQVVNEGQIQVADILINDGRIEKIAASIEAADAQVIDAQGKYVIPGMIDDQVHFREPGLTHKGEIATESAAAVAGGITSYMEMPNVNPLTINLEALQDKYDRAAKKSMANYSFYLGASNDNLEVIKSCPVDVACGIKVFMGASTGNMLVDDPDILEGIFANAPILVATHCESSPIIEANEALYLEKYGQDGIKPIHHPAIRSEKACLASSSFAVDLAKRYGTKLHVLHLTTEIELDLFTAGDINNKQITAEACVHHLYFNSDDYHSLGNLIKCNPAIKRPEDQAAIIRAVNEDRIDIIATDHAPHTWDEKQNQYMKAPSGLPLVQDALLGLFDMYHKGYFTIEKIVQKTSHAVADRFQLKDRGYIREGYWADLVIINPTGGTQRDNDEQILSKCGWSPFAGTEFKASIDSTIINGSVVWHDGQLDRDFRGMKLKFSR